MPLAHGLVVGLARQFLAVQAKYPAHPSLTAIIVPFAEINSAGPLITMWLCQKGIPHGSTVIFPIKHGFKTARAYTRRGVEVDAVAVRAVPTKVVGKCQL